MYLQALLGKFRSATGRLSFVEKSNVIIRHLQKLIIRYLKPLSRRAHSRGARMFVFPSAGDRCCSALMSVSRAPATAPSFMAFPLGVASLHSFSEMSIENAHNFYPIWGDRFPCHPQNYR